MLKPLIVSAPFGNYHRLLKRLTGADFTPTLGTFTWESRGFNTKPYGGRFLRTFLTVRYSPVFKSWVNRIGLKNPGIRWYRDKVVKIEGKVVASQITPEQAQQVIPYDKIISIYGWNMDEWDNLLRIATTIHPMAIELNLSCPNVKKPPFTKSLFEIAKAYGVQSLIAKIPPLNYEHIVEMAYEGGVRIFHATNTYPTPGGGMSGKGLMPMALSAISYLRRIYPDITIIGGGGITSSSDVAEFIGAGANHVAIASMLFNPFNLRKLKSIAEAAGRGQALADVLG